jgi:hypothetical protein
MPRKKRQSRSKPQRGGNFLGDAWNFTRKNHLISGGISAGLGLLGGPIGKVAGLGVGLAGRQFGFGQRGGARPPRNMQRAVIMPSGVRF